MNKSFQVENKCVLVRTGDIFPPFCVKTNKKTSGNEHRARQIKWTKEVKGPKFIKIIYYFMSRQYCNLTFSQAKSVHVKAQLIFLAKLAVMLVGLFGMFIGAAMLWNQFVILAFVGLGLIAAILLPLGNQPLAIVREENGVFWLKGCSDDFLKRLQNQ